MKKINRYYILITKDDVLIINKYGKILKQTFMPSGFMSIELNDKKEYVHRLVAQQYLGAEKIDKIIHINGNKDDNKPNNLQVIKGYYNYKLYK